MFERRPKAEDLRGEKKIVVCGMAFKIRRINPVMDFPDGKMPMIFSSFASRRPVDPDQLIRPEQLARIREDMGMVIRAGVIDPPIVPSSKASDGITVDDLFRDPELGQTLFFEIMVHSLNRFSGWKGVFFSTRTRQLLSTQLRKSMASCP